MISLKHGCFSCVLWLEIGVVVRFWLMKLVMSCVFDVVLSLFLCPTMYVKGKKWIASGELLLMSAALQSHMSLGWPRLLVKIGGKITICSSCSSLLSCCCM